MSFKDYQACRLVSKDGFEWFEEDIEWSNWNTDGAPRFEIVTVDGQPLKSSNGFIDSAGGIYPIFVLGTNWPGFSDTWSAIEPLVVNSSDHPEESLRIVELSPAVVQMDESRSECARTVGGRITLVKSASLLGEALPKFFIINPAPRYHYYFRGDLVNQLRHAGAIDAFDIVVVGELSSDHA